MKSSNKINIKNTRWQTLWLVVGPQLPYSHIMPRENIFFKMLNDEEFENFRGGTIPVPDLAANGEAYVVNYPPRDLVLSKFILQVDILDSDQDEAVNKARQLVEKLLVSFSIIIPGGRYHAEMRKVRRADEAMEYSGWSQAHRISIMDQPQPLQPTDLDRVFNLFDLIEDDETAENAYIHLLTAWQLQDTAGSKPLQRSILQHYVLCIETIVNGVMSSIRKSLSDQIRLEEREFAKEFSKELLERADKPDAIRKASTKLRDISFTNMLPSIERVAPILGLSIDEIETAKNLYRFRSRSLSHPGRAKGEDMENWLRFGPKVDMIGKADMIARAFFFGYCTKSPGRPT